MASNRIVKSFFRLSNLVHSIVRERNPEFKKNALLKCGEQTTLTVVRGSKANFSPQRRKGGVEPIFHRGGAREARRKSGEKMVLICFQY